MRDSGFGLWFGKGVVEIDVERDHLAAELRQNLWRESARRAVSAGDHNLQLAFEGLAVCEVRDVARGDVLVEVIGAAFMQREAAFKNEVAQRAHILRPESQRARHAHLDAGPAIVVVACRDHGNAFDLKRELREIGRGRKRQPDVMHLRAASKHAGYQRTFDARRIGAVIVPRHDPHRHAALPHQRRHGHANRLHPHQVDFLREEPARVVFAETGGLHIRQALEIGGVGLQIPARLRKGLGCHGVLPTRQHLDSLPLGPCQGLFHRNWGLRLQSEHGIVGIIWLPQSRMRGGPMLRLAALDQSAQFLFSACRGAIREDRCGGRSGKPPR